jgi:hypothetical protein
VAVYSQHAGLNTMCVIAQLRCRSWRQTPLPELFGEKAIPCDLPKLSRTLLFDFEITFTIHRSLLPATSGNLQSFSRNFRMVASLDRKRLGRAVVWKARIHPRRFR